MSWIELDGADNVRDLGGLPTIDGRRVQPHRLIRSDSPRALTDRDVRRLVDDFHVRAIVDLRTGIEVANDGPGLLGAEPSVRTQHLSLFVEPDEVTVSSDVVVLPWQNRDSTSGVTEDERRSGASAVYQRYLTDRPDSIIAALRMIATTDGATLVHCAAGKDRTGVVVAFALTEVGVVPDAIVADYARSAERVEAIIARLASRHTYAGDLGRPDIDPDKHKPRPETMRRLLADMTDVHGGIPAWLRAHGWTDDGPDSDAAALRRRLLDA